MDERNSTELTSAAVRMLAQLHMPVATKNNARHMKIVLVFGASKNATRILVLPTHARA